MENKLFKFKILEEKMRNLIKNHLLFSSSYFNYSAEIKGSLFNRYFPKLIAFYFNYKVSFRFPFLIGNSIELERF